MRVQGQGMVFYSGSVTVNLCSILMVKCIDISLLLEMLV